MLRNSLVYSLIILLVACAQDPQQKQSKKDLDTQLIEDPNNVDLLLKRGKIRYDAHQLDKALNDAAKAFRLDSNRIDSRILLADVLNNRPSRTPDDVAAAQRHYKLILKRKPKHTAALVGLASTFSYQMDFEQSFYYINQALRINPRYRDAYIMKGSNYLFLGKKDLAKSSYETAVQQDPKFFEAYLMLGSIYQAEKNPICIEYYRTAVSLQPRNPDVIYSLAYAEQEFNKPLDAIKHYRQMIQLDKTYIQALNQIGLIKQYDLNEVDSAVYYYNSALQSDPTFVEAWHNLGTCYEQKNERFKALDCYKKAVKYNPNFELSRKRAKALSY